MAKQKIIRYVATNDRGLRIGQDHPNAKLTDLEVEALIRDRGPEDDPLMSYSALAEKYGISKSGVRHILIGDRRGQAQRLVKKQETERSFKDSKVRMDLRVSLRARAIVHRLGGGRWLESIASKIDAEMRRAPSIGHDDAMARVIRKFGGVK